MGFAPLPTARSYGTFEQTVGRVVDILHTTLRTAVGTFGADVRWYLRQVELGYTGGGTELPRWWPFPTTFDMAACSPRGPHRTHRCATCDRAVGTTGRAADYTSAANYDIQINVDGPTRAWAGDEDARTYYPAVTFDGDPTTHHPHLPGPSPTGRGLERPRLIPLDARPAARVGIPPLERWTAVALLPGRILVVVDSGAFALRTHTYLRCDGNYRGRTVALPDDVAPGTHLPHPTSV